MDYNVTVGNVCFICDKLNRKILFLKRLKEPMKDKYTGVGGKTMFSEDINLSCIREVKEETGFDVRNIELKGVVKTILKEKKSSWILFVYKTSDYAGEMICCNEGQLEWIGIEDFSSLNLIGFIRRILPSILGEDKFVEATFVHDIDGNVLNEQITTSVVSAIQ